MSPQPPTWRQQIAGALTRDPSAILSELTYSGLAETSTVHVPPDHPLFGAYERLARADHHIEDMVVLQDEALDDFEHLVGTREYDSDDPFIEPWPIPLMFSVLLGDAIHNLRCALDYLAYELVEESSDSSAVPARDRQFPICTSPSDFNSATKKAGLVPHRELLRPYQPFPALSDNQWLLCLRALSNRDKHRMLESHFAAPRAGDFAIIRSIQDESEALIRERAAIIPLAREMARGVLSILTSYSSHLTARRSPWYLKRL